MLYKIINEDNTLVKDYPSPQIYKTMSEEEKKKINLFKNEIEKLTLAKGLGKVSVNVCYDCMLLEKEFIIKHSNGFTNEYYQKEIERIDDHMEDFSKKNNMYDFYLGCHILLGD